MLFPHKKKKAVSKEKRLQLEMETDVNQLNDLKEEGFPIYKTNHKNLYRTEGNTLAKFEKLDKKHQ